MDMIVEELALSMPDAREAIRIVIPLLARY